MKFLKLRISSDFLKNLGFDYLFKYFSEIELLDFYHYSNNNFFALERLVLKSEYLDDWERIIKETHKINYFDLLKKKGPEILAIMNITRETGFFPLIGSDSWAIIPPATIDDYSIHLNILAPSEILHQIYNCISQANASFDILALGDFKQALIQTHDKQRLFPKFTQRQKDIARYAVRNGYFNTPKKITAEEIAKKFNISVSAVNEHLRKARKIALEYFFG